MRDIPAGGPADNSAMAARAMARIAEQAGDLTQARHHLDVALRVARRRGSRHEEATTRWHAARIEAAQGDRLLARAQLDLALESFAVMDMRWHLAEALALLRQLD